jgi:hypothetical protein
MGIFQAAGALTTAPANKYTGPEEKPGQWFADNFFMPSNATSAVATAPAGQALVIKDAHVVGNGGDAQVEVWVGTSLCASIVISPNIPEFADDAVVGATTTDLPYSPGIAVPAGDDLCMTTVNNGAQGEVFGYTLPSAYAPTPASVIKPAVNLHKLPKP